MAFHMPWRKTALPRSCVRWRCPCWTAPAPHTRTTCCCEPKGWEWAHHWTGRKHYWFERHAGALGDQMSSRPCADGTAPVEREGRSNLQLWNNYSIHSTADIQFTRCFQARTVGFVFLFLGGGSLHLQNSNTLWNYYMMAIRTFQKLNYDCILTALRIIL